MLPVKNAGAPKGGKPKAGNKPKPYGGKPKNKGRPVGKK